MEVYLGWRKHLSFIQWSCRTGEGSTPAVSKATILPNGESSCLHVGTTSRCKYDASCIPQKHLMKIVNQNWFGEQNFVIFVFQNKDSFFGMYIHFVQGNTFMWY
uniref:Uncharacterized protein n=1 Tax=Sphaerodactylus townsendi TaxID=933632 RepID=A0ACB8FSP2_9SAUR